MITKGYRLKAVSTTILGSLGLWLFLTLLFWTFQPAWTAEGIAECERQIFGCMRPAQWVLVYGVLSIMPGALWLILHSILFLRTEALEKTVQHMSFIKFGLLSAVALSLLSFLSVLALFAI